MPRHVRRHQREDALHLRHLQRPHRPHGLGPLPRNQPAHPGGNEPRLRGRLDLELGRREQLRRPQGTEPAAGAGGGGRAGQQERGRWWGG